MDTAFWRACALVLLTVVLGLAIGKNEKDFSLLLAMVACCLVSIAAVSCLKPVMDLLWNLNEIGSLQDGILKVLLRCVGIAVVAELAGMICNDAGNGSLGKALQMLGSAAILSLSVPVFQSVLTLIQEILGKL